jgi:NAD-dependent deacetylase
MKKKIVVLSGAGVSAESGISTFRDSDGLWENYDVMEVASIEGWYQNPELVIEFYNQRRTQLANVEPNEAHKIIADLEKHYDVTVITQNVDDLHERAGSTQIIHLHGELTKVCSDAQKKHVKDIGYTAFKFGD